MIGVEDIKNKLFPKCENCKHFKIDEEKTLNEEVKRRVKEKIFENVPIKHYFGTCEKKNKKGKVLRGRVVSEYITCFENK